MAMPDGSERVVQVEGGHISLEVQVNAKGDFQYAAKIVMPFQHGENPDPLRQMAEMELEEAEKFLRARYGRPTANGQEK
jgi:hypothetical protein